MTPAMPPFIILGKSENCLLAGCTLLTELVLELNEELDEVEEDILDVEIVTTDEGFDDETPAVVVSLDFIANSLWPATPKAHCTGAEHCDTDASNRFESVN